MQIGACHSTYGAYQCSLKEYEVAQETYNMEYVGKFAAWTRKKIERIAFCFFV